MRTSSSSNLKANQPKPIVNLNQQQQQQHENYNHHQQQQSQNTTTSQQSQKNQSSRQQKQQNLGNQKKIILSQDELDSLYAGNLFEEINESGLFELFGLRTTNYLRDNSDVQMPLSENTGKRRGFAYEKVPRYLSDKLLKLHGVEFTGMMLSIEKAKALPKAKTINGVNQHIFRRRSLQN